MRTKRKSKDNENALEPPAKVMVLSQDELIDVYIENENETNDTPPSSPARSTKVVVQSKCCFVNSKSNFML